MTDSEIFLAPWPGVLLEMKDFVDLWFLALGGRRHATAVRIFISKALVPQPNCSRTCGSSGRRSRGIPNCRIELKGTEQAAHKIEIEYRR